MLLEYEALPQEAKCDFCDLSLNPKSEDLFIIYFRPAFSKNGKKTHLYFHSKCFEEVAGEEYCRILYNNSASLKNITKTFITKNGVICV